MRAELNHRSRRILSAVVTEYIATGRPVGSRTLARRHGVNLSPATIRNVLADLEDLGLLAQPHTSAGRVPTDRGFRVFVEGLVHPGDISADERELVLSRLQSLDPATDDVMRETGRLLASISGAAAVLTPPRRDMETLAQLHFMTLGEGRLLAVVIARSGDVQNRVVEWDVELDATEIERVNNYLRSVVEGRTMHELRDELAKRMASERGHYVVLRRQVSEMVAAMPEEPPPTLLIEGQDVLFDRPEFGDVGKIRGYLKAFEEHEVLLGLLERTISSKGVQIVIGSEAGVESVQDVCVITAPYGEEHELGSLGVIGPTRMDYAKLVPLVRFTAGAVSEVLRGGERGKVTKPSKNTAHRGSGTG